MIPIEHIHPIIVHFPIVFFLTLAGLDIIAAFRGASITGRTPVGNVAAGLAVLSALAAIAAFMLGGAALDVAEAGGFRSEVAEIHESLGTATAVLLTVWAIFRGFLWLKEIQVEGAMKWLIVLIEVGGAAMIVATAYFGGALVYDLGVNVARSVQ